MPYQDLHKQLLAKIKEEEREILKAKDRLQLLKLKNPKSSTVFFSSEDLKRRYELLEVLDNFLHFVEMPEVEVLIKGLEHLIQVSGGPKSWPVYKCLRLNLTKETQNVYLLPPDHAKK